MHRFLPERPSDWHEVEALFDLSFAPGRTLLSSYRLRDGVEPVAALCTVVRDEYESLAAAIRFWPVALGEARAPGLMLGPIAVHPTQQGEGLGQALIRDGLARAAAIAPRVILIGDAPYYRRFGFARAPVAALSFPPPTNPDRFLGLALETGAFEGLAGRVHSVAG